METFSEEKMAWCKNFIEKALDGCIDTTMLHNTFVQDLFLVAGKAYDITLEIGLAIEDIPTYNKFCEIMNKTV